LTLGASALRWIAAPSSATELVIALSILLLAAEAAHHERDTLTARRPWLVAFLFGLIHGLGFAGVIAERGLPQDHLLTALLGFNLGVELGQLIVLAAALLMAALLRPRLSEAGRDRAHLLAAYAIGIPAGVWVVERAVDWAIHLTRS
ncbi:MAG: HupE/UreJ family protein, partial [Myxococcota bacterium]